MLLSMLLEEKSYNLTVLKKMINELSKFAVIYLNPITIRVL